MPTTEVAVLTAEDVANIRKAWALGGKGGKRATLEILGMLVGVCDLDGLTFEDVVVVNLKAKKTREEMRAAVAAAEGVNS